VSKYVKFGQTNENCETTNALREIGWTLIKCREGGVCNAYLVNSKSNCKCCNFWAFRDLLFVSNTLYRSKIDEMREFLNKNYLISFSYGF